MKQFFRVTIEADEILRDTDIANAIFESTLAVITEAGITQVEVEKS